MIGTEKLELITELALWSGALEGEKPLSLLIIAKVESGKSQLLLKYCENAPGVIILTDCTAFGIYKKIGMAHREGLAGEIHHIIVPDLINPLSRNPATVSSFIATMNALVEEGVVEVQTAYTDLKLHGLNIGLLSSITPQMLRDGRHRWARMGFMSRMVPVSYKYSLARAREILLSITEREYLSDTSKKLTIPKEKVKVYLPPKLAKKMIPLTDRFTGQEYERELDSDVYGSVISNGIRVELGEAEKLYGFRYQKQMQVFLQSRALMAGRQEVTQEDVDSITELTSLFGTKQVEI